MVSVKMVNGKKRNWCKLLGGSESERQCSSVAKCLIGEGKLNYQEL